MSTISESRGAKLTGYELTEIVRGRIENEFPKGRVTELVSLAVNEVFSVLDNLLVVNFTKDRIKECALDNISERLQYLPDHPDISEAEVEKIQAQVALIFDDVYSKSRISTLSQEDFPKLLKIYHKFAQHPYDHGDSRQKVQCNEFQDFYEAIDVECSIETMEKQLETQGCFQLRPIHKEATKLVIGCGNGRVACCGGRPNYMGFYKKVPFYCPSINTEPKDVSYHREYSLKHNHDRKECVTIDPELGSNPTIVALWGEQPLAPLFKGQKFDEIIYEGLWMNGRLEHEKSDVRALLSENGKVYTRTTGNKVELEDVTETFFS